jgi:hypothetical protein
VLGEDFTAGYNPRLTVGRETHRLRFAKAARQVKVNGVLQMSEFFFHRNGRQIGEYRKSWQIACLVVGVAQMICCVCGSCVRNREALPDVQEGAEVQRQNLSQFPPFSLPQPHASWRSSASRHANQRPQNRLDVSPL